MLFGTGNTPPKDFSGAYLNEEWVKWMFISQGVTPWTYCNNEPHDLLKQMEEYEKQVEAIKETILSKRTKNSE